MKTELQVYLLKKIALLIGIILLLSILVELLLPYGWSDLIQYNKIKHYTKNKSEYNALFFGGSLEYRQINPNIVDRVVQQNEIKFKSFNFGVDAHNIIQQLSDIDGIMKIKNDSIKYIFVSMSSEPYFFAWNKSSSKWLAWNNLKSTYDALSILPNAGKPIKERAKFMMLYIRSYAMNLFKVGMVQDVVTHYFVEDTLFPAYIGKNGDGFFSYDDEETYLKPFDENLDLKIIVKDSRTEFVNNTQHRDSLLRANTQQFEQYKTTDKPNQQQVNMLYRFMEKYNKKGIDVYFILPPRARTTYSYLLPIFNALPQDRCIELADPRKYPAFYTYENGYNFHHLNKQGAAIYSKILGNKIADLFKTNLSITK